MLTRRELMSTIPAVIIGCTTRPIPSQPTPPTRPQLPYQSTFINDLTNSGNLEIVLPPGLLIRQPQIFDRHRDPKTALQISQTFTALPSQDAVRVLIALGFDNQRQPDEEFQFRFGMKLDQQFTLQTYWQRAELTRLVANGIEYRLQ